MKRYRKTFEFQETEAAAKAFCGKANANSTRYMRLHHPAYFTPWQSQDGKENLFVCWYYA